MSFSCPIGASCSMTAPACLCCTRCVCTAHDSRPRLRVTTQKTTNPSWIQCEMQFNVWWYPKRLILFARLIYYRRMLAPPGHCLSFFSAPLYLNVSLSKIRTTIITVNFNIGATFHTFILFFRIHDMHDIISRSLRIKLIISTFMVICESINSCLKFSGKFASQGNEYFRLRLWWKFKPLKRVSFSRSHSDEIHSNILFS